MIGCPVYLDDEFRGKSYCEMARKQRWGEKKLLTKSRRDTIGVSQVFYCNFIN